MNGEMTARSERKRRAAVLRVMCLSLMMVVASVASLNVALPSIAADTGATQAQLQWIVDAYALAFAALLLPAGAIGDRFGRKPILATGLALFGLASLAAIFVDSPGALIGLRGVMGIAAAFVMPVTLSVITTIFPPEERGKAVGTWVGVAAGGGGVIGLLVSGLVLQWLSWPAIFGLNVVLAALALAGTIAIVPQTRESIPPRLDPVGTLISVAGLAALVFGLNEGGSRGWGDSVVVASLAIGAAGLTAFVLWELRRRDPMLDPRNFLRRGFGAGSLSVSVQFFAAFGFLFLALTYLQLVLGFAPLRASATLLPMALVVIPLSRVAPAIAARLGVRVRRAIGLSLMAIGFLVMAQLGRRLLGLGVLGRADPVRCGHGAVGRAGDDCDQSPSLPPEKQGVASAVNDVSRELGGALGIAVLGSVMNSGYRSGMADATTGLPPAAAGHVTSSLATAQQVGAQLGAHGQQLIAQAQSAFMDGFTASLVAGAVVLLFGAAFVAIRAPGRAESRANAGVAASASGAAAG